MNKEKYIKPEVKVEVLEAEVLCQNNGSTNGGLVANGTTGILGCPGNNGGICPTG